MALSEAATRLSVACMRDRGWEMELHDDGSIGWEGTSEEMRDASIRDMDECRERYALEADARIAHLTVTPEQAGAWFDVLLESATCLGRLGIMVPPPPSRQAAIEEMLLHRGSLDWHPHLSVPHHNLDELHAVLETCPEPSWLDVVEPLETE